MHKQEFINVSRVNGEMKDARIGKISARLGFSALDELTFGVLVTSLLLCDISAYVSDQLFLQFLVGAFPFREKCSTIAVTVFFLQTTILTLIGPLIRNNPETT